MPVSSKGMVRTPEPVNETFKFQPLAGATRRPKQAAAIGSAHATNPEKRMVPSWSAPGSPRPETATGNGEPSRAKSEESSASFLTPSLLFDSERGAPAGEDFTSNDSPTSFLRPSLLYEVDKTAPTGTSGARKEGEDGNSAVTQPGEELEGALYGEPSPDEGTRDAWQPDETRSDTPKVLVLDREGQLSATLAKAAVDLEPAPEILRLNRSTQVVEVVADEAPDVILVAPEEVTGAGLKRLAEVHRAYPGVVILLSDSGKPLSLSQIAASGASDILTGHPTKARLRSKLAHALRAAEELRNKHVIVTERVVTPDPPVPAPVPIPEAPVAQHTKAARILTVASASGGSGKTFISTNLAAYLAKATGGSVLLVDLDLQFGEIAIALRLRPPQTIAELVEEQDVPAAFPDYVVDHRCGFKVLCAPKDPMSGERIGAEDTTAVLEAARKQFDYVVIDTPPSLNDNCLAAFDQSDSLVILANMDLASLKNLHVFLETLEKLELRAGRVALVVNKAESGTGLNLEEVEPIFSQGFTAVLPYAKEVSRSINTGIPVLEGEPKAEISRKLAEGFMKLVPPSQDMTLPWGSQLAAPRRRRFPRLLKGKAR